LGGFPSGYRHNFLYLSESPTFTRLFLRSAIWAALRGGGIPITLPAVIGLQDAQIEHGLRVGGTPPGAPASLSRS
jgi:hypothetical protein